MKTLLPFFLVLIALPVIAQTNSDGPVIDTTRNEQGSFIISSVIRTKDSLVSKDKIFETLKQAIYKSFGSGDAVIEYESKEEGKIYGRANTSVLTYNNTFVKMNGGRFKYEITILCKQGRAKVILSNITHKGGDMNQMRDGSDYSDDFPSTWSKGGKKQSQREWVKMKEQAFKEFQGLFALFQNVLLKTDSNNLDF